MLKHENFKNIYLTDKVADKDKFDHQDFAEILWRIIQDKTLKEDTTPFNIGIFGKWGVGKSTVVNLFQQKLDAWNLDEKNEKKYKFIDFKIWKFSEDALKRKFIFTIGNALLGEKKLDELNAKVHGQRTFEYSLWTAPEYLAKELLNWRKHTSKRWIQIGLIGACVFDLIVILINLEYSWIKSFTDFLNLVAVFAAAQLPTLWSYLISAINSTKIQISFGRYDSDEQFEEEFVGLVSKNNDLIKIIFIDDLDRCPEDKVIEALETIKTYLDAKTCIFIIACDDEVVKRVVIEKRKELLKDDNGSEYLNKFFQYRLRIPPFIHRNMRDYAKQILEDQKNSLLDLKDIDDILEVLIHKEVVNPRKAISLINSFVADFEVILKREESEASKLRQGDISDNLPALAVFTVIKNDYPIIYDLLIKDSDLLKYLISHAEAKTEFNEEYHKLALQEATEQKKFPEFMHFLDGIKEYIRDIDNFEPYIYLDANKYTASVKSARQQELHRFFRTGQAEKIRDSILELKSDEEKKRHFEFLADWLSNFKVARDKRNGLRVMFEIAECFPSEQNFGAIAFKITSCFISSYQGDEKWVEEFNLEGVMYVLKSLYTSKRQEFIEKLIEVLNKTNSKELVIKLLRAIFKYQNIVVEQQVRDVQTFLSRKATPTSNADLVTFTLPEICDLIEQNSSNELALQKFIGVERIEEISTRIIALDKTSTEKIEVEKNEYERLTKVFDTLDQAVIGKSMGIKKQVQIWITLLYTSHYYHSIIKKIQTSLTSIPKELLPELVTGLSAQLGAVVNEDLEKLLYLIDAASGKSDIRPMIELNSMVKNSVLILSDKYTSKNFENTTRFILNCDDGRLNDKFFEELISLLLPKFSIIERKDFTKSAYRFLIDNPSILRASKHVFVQTYLKELYDIQSYDKTKFPQNEVALFLIELFNPIFELAEKKDDFISNPKLAEFLLPQNVADLEWKERIIDLLYHHVNDFQTGVKDILISKVVLYLKVDKDKKIWAIRQLKALSENINFENDCSDIVRQDLIKALSDSIKDCDNNEDRCKALEILLTLKLSIKKLGNTPILTTLLEEIKTQFLKNKNHSLGFHGFIENYEEFSLEDQVDLTGKYLGLDIFSDENSMLLIKKISESFQILTTKVDQFNFIDKYAISINLDERAWTFFLAIFTALMPILSDESKKEIVVEYIKKIKLCDELTGVVRNRFSIVNKFKNTDFYDEAEIYSLFSALYNNDSDVIKDLACDLLFVYFGNVKKIPKKLREGYKVMIEQALARTVKEDVKLKMTALLGKEGIFNFDVS